MVQFFILKLDLVICCRSERESYGDNAMGYVQVKREGDICTVKARITPEHSVRKKAYHVTLTCNEIEEKILNVQCEDCAAQQGGCKHAVAFLAWLHRRSEDPPSTSIDCYWKKSRLSSVGTSLKFIKCKDLGKQNLPELQQNDGNFLTSVVDVSREVGRNNSQLTKYYKEFASVEKLSINYLLNTIPSVPAPTAAIFLEFCKQHMQESVCREAKLLTTNQAFSPLWHELRFARITASKAYEASHCKTFEGVLVESILGASKIKDTKAMKRGRQLENQVLKEVEKILGVKLRKCGLKLNALYPLMGASPDGECNDFVVEIKCPTSEKALRRYITTTNTITAKFLAQVQLQMHFYNKKSAKFCVASPDFETSKHVNILNVDYDKKYNLELIQKCTEFWYVAVFPILIKNFE